MKQALKTGAIVLAGVAALNVGLAKFANIDLMSYVPTGMFNTVVVALVAVSGGALLYWKFKKQI